MLATIRRCKVNTTSIQRFRLVTTNARLSPFQLRTFTTHPSSSSIVKRAARVARFSGYFLLSSAFGILAIGAGIFVHDAFTYTDKHVDRVPVSPLALHPELGGPKNLPIVRVQVDDEEDEENVKLAAKPRLVIIGAGWGVRPAFLRHPYLLTEARQAISLLQSLHSGTYHVTVVSPETFTTFTPLLPCVCAIALLVQYFDSLQLQP